VYNFCFVPEEGFVQLKVHIVDEMEDFTDMDALLNLLADILGCESISIKIDAVQKDKSFIIIFLIKSEFASLLLQKDPNLLTELWKFKIDWIQIRNKIVKIPQSELNCFCFI
jgi:hypothetical protein